MFRIPVIFLLAALAAFASANGPPAVVVASSGPVKATESYRTTGAWTIAGLGADSVVEWRCTPFVGQGRDRTVVDASISLRPQSGGGPLQIAPLRVDDRTNEQQGQTTAAVAAAVRGVGQATVAVQVEIANPDSPAGFYSTDVDVTVSAL